MTTFWEGRDAKVGFVDFCRLTRWIRSASQLTRLSTVGIWLLLRVERLQAGREREVLERGLREKLCWLTVRAPAVKTGSPPPGRGEEGARKKGWGRAMSPLFLPPIPSIASSCSSKMHLEMDESGAVQWRLLWFCRSLREPQALSKGSSDAVMYVLATCGVREQPQERRGSR